MGKVNACLKRSFIIVISLIAILCALLLAIIVFAHEHIYNKEEEAEMELLLGIKMLYSIIVITLILAIIGMYGACKEKEWALIMFVVGMILGTLFWITIDIQALADRPTEVEQLKIHYLPMLSQNNGIENEVLMDEQSKFQCCGVDQGYVDWGYNIPESCLCTEEPTNPCVEAPRNSSLFEHRINDEPIMIYKESCLPYLVNNLMLDIDAVMAVILGLILLWVLSVVLCILILCQLSKKEDVPVVVYTTEAGNYSPLTDTAEQA